MERPIPDRPLLSPWHRVARDGGRAVFEHGGETVCLEGRAAQVLLPALLPLLDGSRTVDEVVLAIGEPARPAVEHALALLAGHALLTEGPAPGEEEPPAPFAAAALAHAAPLGLSPSAARARIASSRVRVVGAGRAAAELGRLLRGSGVQAAERGTWTGAAGPADELAVVAPSPQELPRLEAWNAAAVETQTPWLQVLPFNGAFAAVGPLYVPGETCCFECFRRRRAANVDYPEEFRALERAPGAALDAPAVATAVAACAAILVLRWALDRDPWLPGTMTALELGETVRLTTHAVFRVPRCPVCSEPARRALPLPWAEAS